MNLVGVIILIKKAEEEVKLIDAKNKKGGGIMFRVRNIKDDKWEIGEFHISNNGDLMKVNVTKSKFGKEKIDINLLSENKYVWQQDIGYDDKYGNHIYEGDICRIETSDGFIMCVVAYIPSRASYMMLDNENSKYYEFHNEAKDYIEIVGNVFDGKFDYEQEVG